MSPNTYTEDQLVEQPAIRLFAELGWETLPASEEVMGASGTLGRETKSEVVLAARLRAVLARLNPSLPAEGKSRRDTSPKSSHKAAILGTQKMRG